MIFPPHLSEESFEAFARDHARANQAVERLLEREKIPRGNPERIRTWAQRFYEERSIQAIPLPGHRNVWSSFGQTLRNNLVAKHQNTQAPRAWLNQIEPFLEGWSPEGETRIVHADLHPGNLLFQEMPSGWVLTGVVDFADAVRAPVFYDLAAPSLYLAEGDLEVTQNLALGMLGARCEVHVLFRWILLHQFSGLMWCLSEAEMENEEGTLSELAGVLLGDV